MIRLLASLILFFALVLPVAAAKRVALVIGNADYKFVPALANPINDASLIERALKNAGFEVIRKDNLDQQGMKLALIEFSRKLKQGAEAGMFYYAGHGIEVDGKNYLVPIDSNMQSKDEADVYNFDVNNFMAMMENSGVPFNIMVLDACRNNPFRGMRATGGGLAPLRAPVGSYVAYATAPGSVAADGEGANSPFTEALAASMATPGLSLEEVFKQTRTKVRTATGGAQVPFDSSAIEGNFFFHPVVNGPDPKPAKDRESLAIEAFHKAGSEIQKLRKVVDNFPDTTWGELAASRIKKFEENFELSLVCDKATSKGILGAYQNGGKISARTLAKKGLTVGKCRRSNYHFYRNDLYDEELSKNDQQFAIAKCTKLSSGECIALQTVFYYENRDDEVTDKNRKVGAVLILQKLSPSGKVEDWNDLEF